MLSETQVRNAKASDRPRKIFDNRGLYLQVMPNGGRYWRFDYVFNDKRKTLALGVYPDVSLAKARRRHQDARERLAEGMDPVVEKPKPEKTFEDVARDWFSYWKAGRIERHAAYVLRRLEADVFPKIGARALQDLTASTFRDHALCGCE
jgi:hypothetical protein